MALPLVTVETKSTFYSLRYECTKNLNVNNENFKEITRLKKEEAFSFSWTEHKKVFDTFKWFLAFTLKRSQRIMTFPLLLTTRRSILNWTQDPKKRLTFPLPQFSFILFLSGAHTQLSCDISNFHATLTLKFYSSSFVHFMEISLKEEEGKPLVRIFMSSHRNLLSITHFFLMSAYFYAFTFYS